MKKSLIILLAGLFVLACEKAPENTDPAQGGEKMTLSAAIDPSAVRVEINTTDDETFNHFWQAGDQIRVFDGAGNGANFDLDGYDALNPSNVANFTGSFAYAPAGAVYPAGNAGAAFDGTNFTVTFPAEQTYTAGTYDPAANVYVATVTGTTLSFKSLSTYVRIALWSETASTAVDHIVLTSLDGGKIAGLASVFTTGDVTMDPSAGSSITLNCTSPVAISDNSAAPTFFYVAVPAVAATGLKVDVYKADGSHLWRNVSVSPLAKKNKVLKMGALEYSPLGLSSAVLVAGGIVNASLKHLAGDDTTSTQGYNVQNTSITKIVIETSKNMTGVKTGTAGEDYLVVSTGANEIVATVKNGVARLQTAADTIVAGSCSYMFMNMRGATAYEGFDSHFAVGDNSYMNYMFRDNVSLPSLDLSDISVYNQLTAKYMTQMFYNCSALVTLTLWDNYMFTRDCRLMFYGCSSMTTLNNSNKIYASKTLLTSTERMFMNCSSLTSVVFNKANFKIAKVEKMGSMFSGCSALASVDVSGFNTENVANMDSLFHNCDALTTLDLSAFDTRKVTTMRYLCNSCDNLTTLDLSGANCSTAAMSDANALTNLICNLKKITTLKLSDAFVLGASRFASGIGYLMLPNPTAVTATLTVYANADIATALLQQVGKPTSQYRAVDAVKAGRLVFKSLDGTKTWKYYSDAELTLEQTSSEVTSTSYVGLGGGEGAASLDDPVADYGSAITSGIAF